jgi:hypothetical protein
MMHNVFWSATEAMLGEASFAAKPQLGRVTAGVDECGVGSMQGMMPDVVRATLRRCKAQTRWSRFPAGAVDAGMGTMQAMVPEVFVAPRR